MNVLFISPNYPPEHWRYVLALREAGHNTLCVGDAGEETFPWELRGAITAYRRVSDLHQYEEVYRAAAGFISQYGRIGRVESLNPYWRDMVEALRGELCRAPNLPEKFFQSGYELYKDASWPPRCTVTGSRQAAGFVKKAGYPVMAEPVTDKRLPKTIISNEAERKSFFKQYPEDEFYLMRLPEGQRIAVTGYALPDAEGICRPAAVCAHAFSEDGLFALPVPVPRKLAEAAACNPGFFTAEAVRLESASDGLGAKGDMIPVCINAAPPAAPLVDCLCAEYGIDFRKLWAEDAGGMDSPERVCMTAVCCRRFDVSYDNLHERILGRLGSKLIRHGRSDPLMQFGDYIYLFSGSSAAELRRGIKFISE